jgi:hypothetical protein
LFTTILLGLAESGDLRHELKGLRVEHVDRILRLVRAVVVKAIRVSGQIVRVRTAPDEPSHPVGRGIDDVMDVSGVVALQDPNGDPVVRIESRYALRRRRPRQEDDAEKNRQYADHA